MLARAIAAFVLLCGLGLGNPVIAYTVDASFTSPTNMEGLWWNSAESGWGVSVTQQGNMAFVTMFTYDAQGQPTWYVASACAVSTDNCHGLLYRVAGGRAPTAAWAGASVNVSLVGDFTLRLSGVNTATATFIIDGVSGNKSLVRQVFNTAPAPTSDSLAKTQMLLGGTWYVSYTIISTFTNTYSFNRTEASTSNPGDYYAFGKDEYGDTVIGGYSTKNNNWSILDTSIIIDRFYVFTFGDTNHFSGCYYQIDPAGSTNLSRCYSMNAFRSPAKSFITTGDEEMEQREAQEHGPAPKVHPDVMESYKSLRDKLQSLKAAR